MDLGNFDVVEGDGADVSDEDINPGTFEEDELLLPLVGAIDSSSSFAK